MENMIIHNFSFAKILSPIRIINSVNLAKNLLREWNSKKKCLDDNFSLNINIKYKITGMNLLVFSDSLKQVLSFLEDVLWNLLIQNDLNVK